MEEWQFKLEAQRLLASAVGANDDKQSEPDQDEEWAAWIAERNAYLDDRNRSLRRFMLTMGAMLAVGAPLAYYVGTNYGNRLRAEINTNSILAATAMCANQKEMVSNIPIGDYKIVAVLGNGSLADCKWMTDEQYAEMKARPGFRQLTPD